MRHLPPRRHVTPQQLLKELQQPTTSDMSYPASDMDMGTTELRTFSEWLRHDFATNPLSPSNILSAIRIYHAIRSGHYYPSDPHHQPVSPGPPNGPDTRPHQQSRPMSPAHIPELPWTIRVGIVWTIITTTVFATVAGWHNFFNYLLTAWAFTTFIPAALLILIWWALPVRHFGSIISLILHGRHHRHRGH